MSSNKHPISYKSITITSVFFVSMVVVLLGAISAIFGIGSAAFTGKFGTMQITTTSVGIVLVVVGLVFLYLMARLMRPRVEGPLVYKM